MEKGTTGDKSPRKRKKMSWSKALTWILSPVLLFVFMYLAGMFHGGARDISWDEFEKQILDRHAADSIEIVNNETAEVFIKKNFANDPWFKPVMRPGTDSVQPGPHFSVRIGSVDQLLHKLDESQKDTPPADRVRLNYVKRSSPLSGLLGWLIPFAVFLLFLRLMGRSSGGAGFDASNPFSFGKSTAILQTAGNKSSVTFNDVAGLIEAKQEVHEIVDFLKDPKLYTSLGAKIPRGVLLVGPPGTGKTLLARAVAGEADVPFFSLSGSEFVEMFVGVGASRVRDLFHQAKEQAPAIVFIDEIDAVGRSRSHNTYFSGSNDERENTLNQLLTEMDGFGANSGVIVLAATNRADMLDPALLRPGRFDRHIYLELPDITEREAIFNVYLRPLKLAGEPADPHFLAAQTPGFSGADIANICNEAALFAARRKAAGVEKQDFLDAIDRVVAGLEKKSRIISPGEKQRIAFHESGHAVVSWFLPEVDPLVKVSIIPRGRSLGAAWYLPEERQLRTLGAFRAGLSAALGGRAAEELIFGEVSSGALDDLEKVTREAYQMVAFYGFDPKLGNISFYNSTGTQDSAFQKPYSEATGRLIDEEVRHLVSEAYDAAMTLLRTHKPGLEALAALLLKKEVVFKEDLESILGPRPQKTAPQTNLHFDNTPAN
ncbi:MAG TPA: ATP-dependent zinc metalloprotease FtsH [Puia sp.]|uniref:ATP-dependent zinc metalloprotease FtsH n=1 Tax=Puia sp. TaxID=2045100 RepID=UPI002CFEF58F|nr:ATP-dependent zinc metalloprotease FtsH [Puia sp.]HVU94194.1 ATP-dependent zinc metalloprotease FtsH [Puia sp.]